MFQVEEVNPKRPIFSIFVEVQIGQKSFFPTLSSPISEVAEFDFLDLKLQKIDVFG